MTDAVIPRDDSGRFVVGGPGGPGRPKGITRAERAAAFLEPHAQALLEATIKHALAGCPQSMKLLLDRCAPVARPEGERVIVPGLREAPTVSEKASAVVDAIATGEITAESGRAVLQTLDLLSRAVKLDDLERRMQAIEQGKSARVIESAPPEDASDLV